MEAESENRVHVFWKEIEKILATWGHGKDEGIISYQECVTDDPGRGTATSLHLKECTDTLGVRHLRKHELWYPLQPATHKSPFSISFGAPRGLSPFRLHAYAGVEHPMCRCIL